MRRLNDSIRAQIVVRLACFATHSEVQKELREEYGIEASRQQVAFYDPTTAAGARRLAPQWRRLFEETRKRFAAELAPIPVSHRAYRLHRLQRILDHPVYSKNPKTVMEALEQAAKEVGEVYTNRASLRHEITGLDGAPIPVSIQEAIQRTYGEEAGREPSAPPHGRDGAREGEGATR